MPRGGARPNAGRKSNADKPRTGRNLRATDEEWQIIKAFAEMVKYGDKQKAKEFVKQFIIDN